MKKLFKISGVLFAILLYFLATQWYVGEDRVCGSDISHPAHTEISQAGIFHAFFVRSETFGSLSAIGRVISRLNNKHPLNCFIAGWFPIGSEQYVKSLLVNFHQHQPPVAFAKSDIIFPFHYFW